MVSRGAAGESGTRWLKSKRARLFVPLILSGVLATSIPGRAHHPEHAIEGALPKSSSNVELVGSIGLTQVPWGIGDVAALGKYAYVAAYSSECKNRNPDGPGGGVHVVDISIPQLPRAVGFISAGTNTYVGEGVHALRVTTPKFTGDLLVMAHESCNYGKPSRGGVSLIDVTDPTKPRTLAAGVGDRNPKPYYESAHPSHSARAWDAGSKAYVVLVDNNEHGYGDVDIMDITDPRRPKLIKETGIRDWPKAHTRQALGMGSFPSTNHHDMWVQKVAGHWYMLVSYWDAGWVMLNVDDPRRPRYVRQSEYPSRDPLTGRPPEGNAHQVVWSADGKYVLGADEDFAAKAMQFIAHDSRSDWSPRVRELPWGSAVAARKSPLNGPTIYGGTGCPVLTPPPPTSRLGKLRGGEERIVVLVEGDCSYRDKIVTATNVGYQGVMIASSHLTTQAGMARGRIACDEASSGYRARIPVLCISHEDFHRLFDSPVSYTLPTEAPAVGVRGDRVDVRARWDGGWGALHLLEHSTLRELDSYAIPEARKSQYGNGWGILSIHEIKADPRPSKHLAYASWYSGGLRVVSFDRSRGIREVGHYVDGNTFWGTFPLSQGADRPLLLMSDVNHGLYIYRYTGPE